MKKKSKCRFVFLQLLGLLLILSCGKKSFLSKNNAPQPLLQQAIFSTVADWSGTDSTFVATQTVLPGYVQLANTTALFATPQIWVVNSADNTISKIDTTTYKNLGTFPLQTAHTETCYNPSRTAVDLDGSVWTGCRGINAYLSRNTLVNSLIPQTVDHKIVKLNANGQLVFSLNVGHAPRGLVLDTSNRMWVANSVDDTIWAVDATTGVCILGENPTLPGGPACSGAPITLPYGSFPYGAAIDQRGHLWTSNRYGGTVSEIDTHTNQVIGTYGPYRRTSACKQIYGIAIDPGNNIWVAGYNCNDVLKIKGGSGVDPITQKTYQSGDLIATYQTGGQATRGVGVDFNGDVWVASSGTNTASKISNATGKVLAVVPVGTGPIGIDVDAYGNAWVVNQTSNNVTRINGLNTNDKINIAVGNGPYAYSNMLGTTIRAIAYAGGGFAYWQTIIDSGSNNPTWQQVSWTASTPASSAVKIAGRCADSKDTLENTAWGPQLTTPGALQCTAGNSAGGRYAQIQVRFYNDGAAAPILKSLQVNWSIP